MVGAIIMAAGMSKRMGIPKQTLFYGGSNLLIYVINLVLETKIRPVQHIHKGHRNILFYQMSEYNFLYRRVRIFKEVNS